MPVEALQQAAEICEFFRLHSKAVGLRFVAVYSVERDYGSEEQRAVVPSSAQAAQLARLRALRDRHKIQSELVLNAVKEVLPEELVYKRLLIRRTANSGPA